MEHNELFSDEVTEQIIRYYSPMVYRIALTRTQSKDDADDIFQEVFLKLVMNKKPFESEEHRKAWIIKVTINCCNSHFVAPWRRNIVSLDDAVISEAVDDTTGGYGVLDNDNEPDVYAQILKLPKSMRDVILLFYYEDMSAKEISQILGTSEVNIRKRLSRARQRLKLEIEGEDFSV